VSLCLLGQMCKIHTINLGSQDSILNIYITLDDLPLPTSHLKVKHYPSFVSVWSCVCLAKINLDKQVC